MTGLGCTMKIAAISVYQVDLPLKEGRYSWADGKYVEVFDSTVVEIETDSGLQGAGEVCPLGPFYLPAFGPGARAGIAELAPHLIGPIAIAAYSYMALIPVIQPPIIRLLTSKQERLIRMEGLREVSRKEKLIFPIAGVLLCCFLAPTALPLLGMLFLGNFLKECGVVERLANSARHAIIDTATIFLGFTVGCSTQADVFLTAKSLGIFFSRVCTSRW